MITDVPFGTFTEDGRRYQFRASLRIEPAQALRNPNGQTWEHEPIPPDAVEVAISGLTYYANKDGSRDRRYSDCVSGGQNIDDLRKVKNSRAQRLAELWDRWHLNGMRAHCAHMVDVLPFLRPDYDSRKHLTCPESGYQYGRAWLYEPIPAEIVAELRALFGGVTER